MDIIDARGLSCPQPVIMTQKAMKSGANEYIIIVDNVVSRENVTRFAEHQGYSVKVTNDGDDYKLELTK